MGGSKLLESFHVSEPLHRSFSSSERLVGILSPIVEPPTALLIGSIADYFHRRSVRPKPVGYNRSRSAVTPHRALQESQRSPAIPALRHEDLKHLTFVIYRTPEIMHLSIDPDEHLVQVPAPWRKRPMMKASFSDRGRKHRTEPVPPGPNRLVADVDAPLEQNILNLPQRQRIADIHHHHEADHLGRAVEITEGIAHRRRLRILARRLKPIYSDNAVQVCLTMPERVTVYQPQNHFSAMSPVKAVLCRGNHSYPLSM